MRFPLAVALVGCAATEPCASDADCTGGVCLDDLDRGDRYCTQKCASHDDCPAERYCQETLAGPAARPLCLERVRGCRDDERCNGLDDDCDGEVDDDCEAIAPCWEDFMCGLFVCTLVGGDDDPSRICRPEVGPGRPGALCDEPTDCYNGACPHGVCAPMCGTDLCPAGRVCVSAGLEGDRDINVCLEDCSNVGLCREGLVCRTLPNYVTGWEARVCVP